MSLEATIQENTNAIRELIAALAHGVPTTAAQVAAVVAEIPTLVTEAKPEKPAKKTQVAATQESSTPTAPDSSESSSSETEEPPSYQETAAAITKLSRTKGRDAAVSLLGKFGAVNLKEVKPEQFASVIAAANEATGA